MYFLRTFLNKLHEIKSLYFFLITVKKLFCPGCLAQTQADLSPKKPLFGGVCTKRVRFDGAFGG